MKYVYIKDPEGFVSKKRESEVAPDETIISAEEFRRLSGDDYYEVNFGHGGKRVGAGRKQKYTQPLNCQIRVSEQEKDFIMFAREQKVDYVFVKKLLSSKG